MHAKTPTLKLVNLLIKKSNQTRHQKIVSENVDVKKGFTEIRLVNVYQKKIVVSIRNYMRA